MNTTAEQQKDTTMERFLTFTLGDETYGFPVGVVKEVLESVALTCIPRTTEYMKGVFNLRSSIIPVIDIRLLFKLGKNTDDNQNSVIVVDVVEKEGVTILGILADNVKEVIELSRENIESGDHLNQVEFVRKIGKKDDQFILILDIYSIIKHVDTEINKLTQEEQG
ncbi:MAG: chemotaxis protein CheW [Spirochaetaceae bacterium]|nr:chemotaxis protein CheW [Spirochaetaceae bacterium]